MKTQVHGDMLHIITQIDKLRRIIAQIEQFDESTLNNMFDMTVRFYEHPAKDEMTVQDSFLELHEAVNNSLERLNKRLSILESSVVV